HDRALSLAYAAAILGFVVMAVVVIALRRLSCGVPANGTCGTQEGVLFLVGLGVGAIVVIALSYAAWRKVRNRTRPIVHVVALTGIIILLVGLVCALPSRNAATECPTPLRAQSPHCIPAP
ncbi:MAG TPA: hypothetical protein VIV60_05855, partial [Polyangiaceae bacterium]